MIPCTFRDSDCYLPHHFRAESDKTHDSQQSSQVHQYLPIYSSMRPLPGGDALSSAKSRSRKSSLVDPLAVSSHVPTTFFMKSEEEMEQSLASSKHPEPPRRQHENTFGVQSLEDTLEAAFGHESRAEGTKVDRVTRHVSQGRETVGRLSSRSPRSSRKESESRTSSPTMLSRRKPLSNANNTMPSPITPFNPDLRSPMPSAISSTSRSISLQSLKLSDEESSLDGVASQAIASSEEEEETMFEASSSFPQLVMPSIQMPARRPFTAKGKAMGKLKLLVAGEVGMLLASYTT
jgi:hypothetical protein